MKRVALPVVLLFSSGIVFAADPPQHLHATVPATITVTGIVTEDFPPDTAILNLAVETSRESAEDAARENAEKSAGVVKAMKKFITTSRGDSVTTSSFSVQPTYEYDDKLRKNRLVGYRTFNQVTVRSANIASVGEMIDRALKSGANSVTDIRFGLKDNRQQCDRLLVKAAQRARSDADTVATALGVRIEEVRHLAPTCGGEQRPVPVFRAMATAKMADSAEPTTPIEAGALSLTAQVQAEFTLRK